MPNNKNAQLGRVVRIHHLELVNLYDCIVGDETPIGAFVDTQGLVPRSVRDARFFLTPLCAKR